MNAVELIERTIAARTAAGLSMYAYGAEGYTQERPFTAHAKDADTLNRWIAQHRARGFTVGVVNPS